MLGAVSLLPGSTIRQPRGRVYVWVPDRVIELGGKAIASVVGLERLDGSGAGAGRLWGKHVRVRNAAVVHEPGHAPGQVVQVAIGDARPDERGDFLFEPQRGGARLDKFMLRSEKYRLRYVEAARFGEVNTYYHVDRIAEHVAQLLREIGAASLPRLIVVVNAHHAAVQHSDGTRDGVLYNERWVPFQGGHYRLPARRHRMTESEPISPDGEVHLGPGWKLLEHGALVEAAGGRYRHIASHNLGTIYHEYGHHITRHTADFRANALLDPARQSNKKTALDEGFCDYWAATMLDTPHIWAFHRRHDDQEIHGRSLAASASMEEFDSTDRADPHWNGTILASALWDVREHMRADGERGARECDKLVLQALLLIGRATGFEQPPSVESVRHARASFPTALAALLRADEMLYGSVHAAVIHECFERRGTRPEADGALESSVVFGNAGVRGERTQRPRRGGTHRAAARVSHAALADAIERMCKHVPAGDIPETSDLFARGELGARLRSLAEPPYSLVAIGDTMLGGRTDSVIAHHGAEHVFKFVRPLLRRGAIVLGNHEGPIAAEARQQARNFSHRVAPRLARALKLAGFNGLTRANNRLVDCGRGGVLETLDALDDVGIKVIGAGVNERAAHEPAILQAGTFRVGLLGYYWNRRTAARASLPGSAMDPREALLVDIGHLRERVDRVVVTFHWGVPYVREPSAEDRAKARFAIDCGADAVIGHHAHVLQALEVYRGRPIFYGIGNFAFGSGNSKGEGAVVATRFEEDRTVVHVYALYVKNRDPRVAYQPRVLRGEGAAHYFARMIEPSKAEGAHVRIEDFRCVLELPWGPPFRASS